ncbi:MAG: tRNA (adenosine(37)-N6)-threonylcarbamoyltransferase complex ATPase subunit type 1 TsaE [Burkholderiales bacterium]|nr:tRNA (adenosine(37)-N6)-threonylcarbamoyltransferase complex ATPase subunit type 1 TsaE [Burkholderiales bacterium]
MQATGDSPPLLGSITMGWSGESDCAGCAHHLAGAPGLRLAHIALHGNLGAGKTTWVRHLLRALGVQGRIKSPSYTIVEPYELPAIAKSGNSTSVEDGNSATTSTSAAWHFDFYRFADPQEWEDAGLRDIFASPGLKLVEWPERADGLLPPPDLDLTLTLLPDGTGRSVQVDARSLLGLTLLHTLT